MRYLEEKDQVIYQSGKKGSEKKVFPALDGLAALLAHILNRGEQMLRYYGWYSLQLPKAKRSMITAFLTSLSINPQLPPWRRS